MGGNGDNGGGGNGGGDNGGGGNGGGGGGEIHFLTDNSSDAFREFFSRVKQDFEEETDYSVRMEYKSVGGAAEERLATLLQAGTPPEVFLTSASQTGTFINQGSAAPVSEAFNSVSDRFGTPSGQWRARADDEDYLVPLWGNIGMTWYRTDTWGDENPDTWDKTLSMAKAANGKQDTAGAFVAAGQDFCTELQLLGWVYSNGGTVCTREGGEVTVNMASGSNRKRWVETLSFLQDLHEYSPKNSGAGCSQMSQALASKTSSQAWYVGSRPKNQAAVQDRAYASDIAAQPQPTPKSGMDPATCGIAEGLVSFQGANNEAANEYIDFLFQPKYLNTIYFLTPIHNLPAFPELTKTDKYQSRLDEIISEGPWTQQDVEAARTSAQNFQTLQAETSPPNPYAGPIYASRKLSEIMFDAVIRGDDPGAVVDRYADQIQTVIEDSRGG